MNNITSFHKQRYRSVEDPTIQRLLETREVCAQMKKSLRGASEGETQSARLAAQETIENIDRILAEKGYNLGESEISSTVRAQIFQVIGNMSAKLGLSVSKTPIAESIQPLNHSDIKHLYEKDQQSGKLHGIIVEDAEISFYKGHTKSYLTGNFHIEYRTSNTIDLSGHTRARVYYFDNQNGNLIGMSEGYLDTKGIKHNDFLLFSTPNTKKEERRILSSGEVVWEYTPTPKKL